MQPLLLSAAMKEMSEAFVRSVQLESLSGEASGGSIQESSCTKYEGVILCELRRNAL